MLNLAILGCGQIGSRHLQSLALLEEPATIHLVDPSLQSLETAEARFSQAVSPERSKAFCLIRHGASETLPSTLDLAIVASSSFHRADLCEGLLKVTKPEFVILEKFLFPRVSDYDRIGKLLTENQVPTYVNQWMATTFAFQRIASWIGDGLVDMKVSGRGWGLCCNAVHYIEPFQHLTGRQELTLQSSRFEEGFEDSKRNGYRELFGAIKIDSADGSKLDLCCGSGQPEEAIHIGISSGNRSVQVDFYMDRFQCHFQDGHKEWDDLFWIPMQSQLTHRFVQQLLWEGKCGLPEFAVSSAQHRLVLEPFLDHFRKNDPTIGETCPIT
jgi:hypothetical protein